MKYLKLYFIKLNIFAAYSNLKVIQEKGRYANI